MLFGGQQVVAFRAVVQELRKIARGQAMKHLLREKEPFEDYPVGGRLQSLDKPD